MREERKKENDRNDLSASIAQKVRNGFAGKNLEKIPDKHIEEKKGYQDPQRVKIDALPDPTPKKRCKRTRKAAPGASDAGGKSYSAKGN